jgi:D-sedoheptulose 7-phosphate isomerase
VSSRAASQTGSEHVRALARGLEQLEAEVDRVEAWGSTLAKILAGGGRLLAVGNGGSAAQAQHLTSELVGRYRDDRPPLSALALHAETSAFTAISNDFGADAAFARQVQAHGRPGDVLLALSTSGRSANVLEATRAAAFGGLLVWAFTGPRPNPLEEFSDDALAVEAAATATIQEVHQVAIHLLCSAVDSALGIAPRIEIGPVIP